MDLGNSALVKSSKIYKIGEIFEHIEDETCYRCKVNLLSNCKLINNEYVEISYNVTILNKKHISKLNYNN